jgi:hypothetical protein
MKKERLEFIKSTKNTVVYGNDTIPTVYLPKEFLEKSGIDTVLDEFPKAILLNIEFEN